MLENKLRVLVFGDDGYEMKHENLPRTKVILDTGFKKENRNVLVHVRIVFLFKKSVGH